MVIDIDGIEKRALQFRVFLMMPFLNELNWLHEEIIAAGADVKARVWRADDIFEAGIIIEQIRDRMFGADAIIAVCTGRNANVFYELGLADQIHKPILVAAEAQDLPFDVTHFRAQLYGPEGSADRDTFRQRLGRAIQDTIQERGRSEVRVVGQSMMKFHVVNLIRTGELTPVPVDVAELLKRVKDYEDRGETAPRYPIENEQMLGRPWSTVQRLAEELALLIPDFDLDVGPCERLTDRGRRLLLAIPGWYGWERERAADENDYQAGQTKA
jgi:hypothetical protein